MVTKKNKVNWRWITKKYRELGQYKIISQSNGTYNLYSINSENKHLYFRIFNNQSKEFCEDFVHIARYERFIEFKKWYTQNKTFKRRNKEAIWIPPKNQKKK